MPWAANSELPSRVRNVLPEAAQTRFRMTANKAMADGGDDTKAIREGWKVVAQGWQKPSQLGGVWTRRVHTDPPSNPFHDTQGRLTGNPSYGIRKDDGGVGGGADPGSITVGAPASSSANIGGMTHLDGFLGSDGKPKKKPKHRLHDNSNTDMAPVSKADPRTLYVARYVVNAAEIIAWAKDQGFKQTMPADELHVTIAYSKRPVDWIKVGNANNWGGPGAKDSELGYLTIMPGGPRLVEPLGDKGAVVLLFASEQLTWRNKQITDDGQATWEFEGYQPHITITWDAGDVDLDDIEPYQGKIVFGPEIFAEVNDNWSDNITEKAIAKIHKEAKAQSLPIDDYKIAKVDDSLGLVFGWAIVSKVDGQDYYDLNIDKHSGERVPEHIPETTMLKAASDFMEGDRVHKIMHDGEEVGKFVFAFPLTTDIAKAMGIQTKVTGLMVAAKPSPEMLKRFQSGELTGFSIGGSATKTEDIEHDH